MKKKIDKAILNSLENHSKLLGICVGMQALFSRSEEGNLVGLNLIKGEIKKFRFSDKSFKIPHMGWNKVNFVDSKFKENLCKTDFILFIHILQIVKKSKIY